MQDTKPKLDIYLRTHTGSNMHAGKRFVSFGKELLVEGCAQSLLYSIAFALEMADIRLTIIDDHSRPDVLDRILFLARTLRVETTLVRLGDDEKGNSASLRATYRLARETSRDFIYFVEDDYLHCDTAISELIEARAVFGKHLGLAAIALVPVDEPDNYGRLIEESRIVLGTRRHFRTIKHSTGTLMLSKNLFVREWDIFAALGLYGIVPDISEGSTINRIWETPNTYLFAPLPTLAVHMQFEGNRAPYAKWELWWKRYARMPLGD